MPVNPQAPQANNANRADQDSPFALLMAASAPKEDEPVHAQPGRAQDDREKPANEQASAQPAPAKPQAQAESRPKAKRDEKTKPDENKTAQSSDQDTDDQQEVAVANDNSAPTPETKPVAANPVPQQQPAVPLIVIAEAVDKAPAPETPAQESAAPVATAATQPVQDLAALAAANDVVSQTKPTAEAPAPAETQQAPQPQQATTTQAATPQIPVSETSQDVPRTDPQPAAPQPAVQQTAAQQTAAQPTEITEKTATAPAPTTAKEALVQIATLQNPSSAKPADEPSDAPASTDTAIKTDPAKPVTHDIPAAQAEVKDGKADAPRPETAKAESVKPDMAQPAPVESAAPKSAPQIQTPPSTNIAATHANAVLQPQTNMPGALPGIPQHVQVSAEAAKPNMPALAVEIAAKSQSGAKQFDIRLDPPELGRVEVRLSIDAAGKASAHLSADQPQTLDLLQKDASSLTRALREAGLNVSQDGLNFSLRQQNHDASAQQGQGQGQGQGRNASRGMNLIATNSIEATQNSANWRGDGRLDIRV